MIFEQLVLWVILSIASALSTYWFLTEGKNKYLFVTTIVFSLFFGIATSYIWLQITNGLSAFGWGVAVLPVLFSFIAELLLISFYVYSHKSAVFPRVPKYTHTKAVSMVSLAIIFFLTFLLASAYVIPPEASQMSITVLGSSTVETLDVSEILSTQLPETSSPEILIQSSVVTPLVMRDNAKVGEDLNFKVEFEPKLTYVNPVLKVFVQDSNSELINQNNILLYESEGNIAEGQITCDEAGAFTLTAVVYDLSISNTFPVASSIYTYTVQEAYTADEGANFTTFVFILLGISLIGFIIISTRKK